MMVINLSEYTVITHLFPHFIGDVAPEPSWYKVMKKDKYTVQIVSKCSVLFLTSELGVVFLAHENKVKITVSMTLRRRQNENNS